MDESSVFVNRLSLGSIGEGLVGRYERHLKFSSKVRFCDLNYEVVLVDLWEAQCGIGQWRRLKEVAHNSMVMVEWIGLLAYNYSTSFEHLFA